VRRAQRTLRIAAICAGALAALLIVAPAALAADGEGLAGRVTDKTITFFCFGVILFFPVLVVVLSTIQGRLEANKDRRRYELERFGE
jgi:putative copper export protein